MNKTALQQQIIATLEADREVAKAVLAATHEAATHAESKAENKYDTRGLEAAYLADGQRRRLHEIETALAAYRNLQPGACLDGNVRVGALLCLEHDGHERWFFLGPDAAGLKLQHEGREILVISPRSPLGQGLLGRQMGDEVELQVNGQRQCYEVLEIG
ncbi:GreA/GreB family elongation factor [Pseudomonas stutzeri]|uniref:Transcription elongation factor GreAB n=1 Tax=Stutzerimonas stutzeri TaxID=316 RepID=A0A2N8S696_STUST|nr:GreA/GreB family elongation factor [Stutzerimonas stutzeri]MCQ4297647.1 GreA/GreB family elongation factor [Stutzerimonas stutzeri]PNF82148.1 transcription elongation factor GreAB [Stutzerimonas stutzeri]